MYIDNCVVVAMSVSIIDVLAMIATVCVDVDILVAAVDDISDLDGVDVLRAVYLAAMDSATVTLTVSMYHNIVASIVPAVIIIFVLYLWWELFRLYQLLLSFLLILWLQLLLLWLYIYIYIYIYGSSCCDYDYNCDCIYS